MHFIKTIIDAWDPINLLSHAPRDEYHSEIEAIERFFKCGVDEHSFAKYISQVFSTAFGNTFSKTEAECQTIASKIFQISTIEGR